MPVQNTPDAAEEYATEDMVFTSAIRYSANQLTPNIWRKTVKRLIFARIKKAFLGYSSTPPILIKQQGHNPNHDPFSVGLWLCNVFTNAVFEHKDTIFVRLSLLRKEVIAGNPARKNVSLV